MKTVIVASENPVKIAVAKAAFATMFPDDEFIYEGVKSESGVPDQPINEQTQQGALNRLVYIKVKRPEADYWISQEGGIHTEGNRNYSRATIAVADRSSYTAVAETAKFYLPRPIVTLISDEGMELGHAIDAFFTGQNTKHGIGAVGHVTDGRVTREEYYAQAAIIALAELVHKDWYL